MKNVIHSAAWPMWCVLLFIGMACVRADAAPQASVGIDHSRSEACLLECGKVLVDCERQRPRGAHCARDFQMCRGDCDRERQHQLLDAKQQQRRLCHQRCELSTALCEQDAAQQQKLEHCNAGVSQCKARC